MLRSSEHPRSCVLGLFLVIILLKPTNDKIGWVPYCSTFRRLQACPNYPQTSSSPSPHPHILAMYHDINGTSEPMFDHNNAFISKLVQDIIVIVSENVLSYGSVIVFSVGKKWIDDIENVTISQVMKSED